MGLVQRAAREGQSERTSTQVWAAGAVGAATEAQRPQVLGHCCDINVKYAALLQRATFLAQSETPVLGLIRSAHVWAAGAVVTAVQRSQVLGHCCDIKAKYVGLVQRCLRAGQSETPVLGLMRSTQVWAAAGTPAMVMHARAPTKIRADFMSVKFNFKVGKMQ